MPAAAAYALGVLSLVTAPQAAVIDDASARAAGFDLAGAADALTAAAARNDAAALIAAPYVRGLLDAREAFRQGGAVDALEPVRSAILKLQAIARGQAGPAEIARLTLQAAAAAAQSERDEMRVYLDAAVQMEGLQRAAGLPGAPVVSAAEVAGDLWLQVHRYEEARRAYASAADRAGTTPKILLGLARASQRLDDTKAACISYRGLLEAWGSRRGTPAEIAEARQYVAKCGATPP